MPCSTHSKDENFKGCQEMGFTIICFVSSPWLDVEFFAMPMNCALGDFQTISESLRWAISWNWLLSAEPQIFCSERLTRCKSKCNFSFISLGGIILCNWTYSKYMFAKSQLYSKYKCIQSITHGPPHWSVPANDLRKLNYRVHESKEKLMHNLSSSWTDCSMFTAPNAWYVTEVKLYGLETVLSLMNNNVGGVIWHNKLLERAISHHTTYTDILYCQKVTHFETQ